MSICLKLQCLCQKGKIEFNLPHHLKRAKGLWQRVETSYLREFFLIFSLITYQMNFLLQTLHLNWRLTAQMFMLWSNSLTLLWRCCSYVVPVSTDCEADTKHNPGWQQVGSNSKWILLFVWLKVSKKYVHLKPFRKYQTLRNTCLNI